MMTDDERERRIISGAALFETMGGFHVVAWDAATRTVETAFEIRREFCHTGATICQGGFITAWLDASMAHAVIYDSEYALSVSSLDINVSFLDRVAPGPGRARGRVLRRGKRVAFLEAELVLADGRVAARATSSGLIVPYTRADGDRLTK